MSENDDPIKRSQDRFNELNGLILIDKNNLDDEAIKQPQLYADIARERARAMARYDQAEAQLKYVKAEVDMEIREQYAQQKVTETFISNQVILSVKYNNAQQEALVWKHLDELWRGLARAAEQRNDALASLGRLYTSGYFARASIEGVTSRAVDNKGERVIAERKRERPRLDD